MARVMMIAVMICGMLASTVLASDNFVFNVIGNNETFGLGLDYRPGERASIGLETAYFDGLKPEESVPTITVKAVGKYYYSLQNDLNLYMFNVKADSFAGLGLGGEFATGESVDNVADVRTGIEFGEGKIRLGFTYLYNMTDLLWSGDNNGEHILLGSVSIKF